MIKKTEGIPFLGLVEIEDEAEGKTQQQIANEMGVTRTAVGLTEKRAKEKFKEIFLAKYKKNDYI